jgi:hypothetical protein
MALSYQQYIVMEFSSTWEVVIGRYPFHMYRLSVPHY